MALAGRRVDIVMRDELAAWNTLGVYVEVARLVHQPVISTRWVHTEKLGDLPTDPSKRKSRLCLRGLRTPTAPTSSAHHPR